MGQSTHTPHAQSECMHWQHPTPIVQPSPHNCHTVSPGHVQAPKTCHEYCHTIFIQWDSHSILHFHNLSASIRKNVPHYCSLCPPVKRFLLGYNNIDSIHPESNIMHHSSCSVSDSHSHSNPLTTHSLAWQGRWRKWRKRDGSLTLSKHKHKLAPYDCCSITALRSHIIAITHVTKLLLPHNSSLKKILTRCITHLPPASMQRSTVICFILTTSPATQNIILCYCRILPTKQHLMQPAAFHPTHVASGVDVTLASTGR